jgi:hypothetical protein
MPDEPDPPRKFYGFKPREFDRANGAPSPASAPPPPPPAPDPGITSGGGSRIDVRDLNRLAATGQPLLGPKPALVPKNEVHDMLKQNLAVANAAGLNAVAPVRKYHRRKRDFLVLMIGGNLFIVTVYSVELLIGFQVQCLAAHLPFELYNLIRYAFSNPVIYGIPLICMTFFSVAVSWILYGVLDDY